MYKSTEENQIYKVADLFCGAGGTSTGIIQAAKFLGVRIDLLAVNHWGLAISTHSANHPDARHLCENLDNVNPRDIVPGGYLKLMVASPECTHHSVARGGKPKSDQSRASAWHVLRWAEALYIENILIENVPEFVTWGPLDKDMNPIQHLKGQTYIAFMQALRSLGYNVSARVLNAADYGDPTTRKRLFILARREKPVVWPEPTHSKTGDHGFMPKARKWRTARSIIDWSIEGESIFTRKKPLSPNTMRRIMRGLEKFSGVPFVTAKGEHIGLCQPFLVQYHGEKPGTERVKAVDEPLPTVDTSNRFGLCQPFVVAINHGKDDIRSYNLDNPMPTVTSVDAWGLVEPFLVQYNGTADTPKSVDEPLNTVTGKDRFGLVISLTDGRRALVDIRYRMLQPHELAAAMSFPPEYKFLGNRSERVKQIGNAVPVSLARALAGALLD